LSGARPTNTAMPTEQRTESVSVASPLLHGPQELQSGSLGFERVYLRSSQAGPKLKVTTYLGTDSFQRA
jgi:hypothetical protein